MRFRPRRHFNRNRKVGFQIAKRPKDCCAQKRAVRCAPDRLETAGSVIYPRSAVLSEEETLGVARSFGMTWTANNSTDGAFRPARDHQSRIVRPRSLLRLFQFVLSETRLLCPVRRQWCHPAERDDRNFRRLVEKPEASHLTRKDIQSSIASADTLRAVVMASASVSATTMKRTNPIFGADPARRRVFQLQIFWYRSTMARALSGLSLVTMFKPIRAARSALSGEWAPYHNGGCGFCSGSNSIGTFSNWW